MDNTAHTGLFTGGEQGTHSRCMDARRVLTRAVLQDTSTVNDRINAIEMSKPFFRLMGRCNIQSHPSGDFQLPMWAASEPDHLMSLSRKARRDRRSDQACRSGYQNPHRGVPRAPA